MTDRASGSIGEQKPPSIHQNRIEGAGSWAVAAKGKGQPYTLKLWTGGQDLRPLAILRCPVTMGTNLVAKSFKEGISPLAE